MRVRPEQPDWPERDRFVLSKGHASVGLYATLALRGYFPVADLPSFDSDGHDPAGPPGHDPDTRRRHVDRLARDGDLGGRGDRARRPAPGPRRPDVRAARRRGVPGGRGLGIGLRGRPLRARPAGRHRRPQSAPAVRLAGRLGRRTASRPRRPASWSPSGRRSAGACSTSTGTTCGSCSTSSTRRRAATGDRSRSSPTPSRVAACRTPRAASNGTPRSPSRRSSRWRWPSSASRPADRGGRPMTLPMGRAMREAFGETVTELADTDPRVVMLDGDLGVSTKADIFQKAHPERYLQTGIAEQNMLGMAAGLASVGMMPFISTFVPFAVVRPLDQIRVLIAQPHLNVKITAGYAGLFVGAAGKTHQAVDDVSIMRAMPGMVVDLPGRRRRDAARAAAGRPATTAPSTSGWSATRRSGCSTSTTAFEFGRAVVVRDGRRRHPDQHRRRDAARRRRGGAAGRARHRRPRPARADDQAARRRGDRGRRRADEPGHHRRGAQRDRRARRGRGRDARPSTGRRGSCGSGSRTSSGNRPRTTTCSTSTACPRRASPSRSSAISTGWPERARAVDGPPPPAGYPSLSRDRGALRGWPPGCRDRCPARPRSSPRCRRTSGEPRRARRRGSPAGSRTAT